MFKVDPILAIDGYKSGHLRQYPDNTEFVLTNFTPRSAGHAVKLDGIWDNKVVFFGMQGFVKNFLIDLFNTEFFQKPKDKILRKYARRMDTYLGPGAVTVEHIAALHDLGYLPISIYAVPEGSHVNIGVPVFMCINTHKDFGWLPNYLETVFSDELWGPCTSATIAAQYRKLIDGFADATGGFKGFVEWQGHDFSMRGMGGTAAAAVSGAGHLLSFAGTDTIPAIQYLEEVYGADAERELVGGSVPATEHSVSSGNISDILAAIESGKDWNGYSVVFD